MKSLKLSSPTDWKGITWLAAESFPPCIFIGQEKEKATSVAAQTRVSESYCFL